MFTSTNPFLKIIIKESDVPDLTYYAITLFGAAVMYSFALERGFHGTIRFLENIFPKKERHFYVRTDFFLVTITGSIIGTIFFSPSSAIEALAAGLGWVGAINVLGSENKKIKKESVYKVEQDDA